LPEAAQWMAQVDPPGAVEVLRRWFAAAAASQDSEGMTQAGIAMLRAAGSEGAEALRQTYALLVERIDCPSMGDFSRQAAAVEPELVLDLAPRIPDRRERRDALVAAAAG